MWRESNFLREDNKTGQPQVCVLLPLVAIIQEGPKAAQSCQGTQALFIRISIQGLITTEL